MFRRWIVKLLFSALLHLVMQLCVRVKFPRPLLRPSRSCGWSWRLFRLVAQSTQVVHTRAAISTRLCSAWAERSELPDITLAIVFFLLLGLARQCRPCMWEGSNRVDLIQSYAPWAADTAVAECAVDGIVCCLRSLDDGRVEMVPVSEEHPLHECRHFVAGHKFTGELECEGTSMQAFYGRLGVALLGTVADGDCGLDTACMMLGIPQTAAHRDALRREVSDYLCERFDTPWMHRLLVASAELNADDMGECDCDGEDAPAKSPSALACEAAGTQAQGRVGSSQAGDIGKRGTGTADGLAKQGSSSAVATAAVADARATEGQECKDALQWSTGLRDAGAIAGLIVSLPEWALQEQVLAYRRREKEVPKTDKRTYKIITVEPGRYASRCNVAAAYDDYLCSCGVTPGGRVPRGRLQDFLQTRLHWLHQVKNPARCVRRWHHTWRQDAVRGSSNKRSGARICYQGIIHSRRKRKVGGGRPVRHNWVRESLFEWFVSVRHSVDWKKFNAASEGRSGGQRRSGGRYKAMCRFPTALVKQKASQFLQDYLRACLVSGITPKAMNIDWKWLKRWQYEYGLSLRSPNRKFKVAKAVLEERLTIFWLNLSRVRALCEFC